MGSLCGGPTPVAVHCLGPQALWNFLWNLDRVSSASTACKFCASTPVEIALCRCHHCLPPGPGSPSCTWAHMNNSTRGQGVLFQNGESRDLKFFCSQGPGFLSLRWEWQAWWFLKCICGVQLSIDLMTKSPWLPPIHINLIKYKQWNGHLLGVLCFSSTTLPGWEFSKSFSASIFIMIFYLTCFSLLAFYYKQLRETMLHLQYPISVLVSFTFHKTLGHNSVKFLVT